MKITLQLVVVVILACPTLVIAQKNQLPQAANAALEKMNREIEIAKRDAVDTLKKIQKEEMKNGNLQTANLLQEKIDELSPKPSLQALVGKWKGGGNQYEFFMNGTATFGDKNRGSWTYDKAKSIIIVRWDFGNIDNFNYPPIDGVMKSSDNAAFVLFKDKKQ